MPNKIYKNQVQAILFKKDKWSSKKSLFWLKEHNYNPIKEVHITKNFRRYRIRNPDKFKRFITKKLKNNIDLIIGFKI